MPTCLIDQTEHVSAAALHKHLRTLKVKQADYYVKYHDRRDRFTGEPIPFKSVDQYLSAEFLTKDNLRKWIATNPAEGRQWAVDWLARRKAEKDLVYPPTQVELETMLCPSMHYYDRVGGYNAICRSLNYVIRFEGGLEMGEPIDQVIVTDTREQQPLDVGGIRAKLNVGDYGLNITRDVGVYIERKSLGDFIGTLSLGHERFLREMERAKEVGAYLIILVESLLADALAFKPKHGTVSMGHVFKNLRDLLSYYTNVQALFVKNRAEAARVVVKLLEAGESVKYVDLQYALERGAL
jgi:ERCC4 domain-containing protein